MLTNAQLKRLCRHRRIRFVDTTINGFANHFTVDGVSYSEEGIRKVVEKLATPITHFLGWECAAPVREAPESAARTKKRRKASDKNTPQGDSWAPTRERMHCGTRPVCHWSPVRSSKTHSRAVRERAQVRGPRYQADGRGGEDALRGAKWCPKVFRHERHRGSVPGVDEKTANKELAEAGQSAWADAVGTAIKPSAPARSRESKRTDESTGRGVRPWRNGALEEIRLTGSPRRTSVTAGPAGHRCGIQEAKTEKETTQS